MVHLSGDQLRGYTTQSLTDAEREAMDRHLSLCPECRARLDVHERFLRRLRYDLQADLRDIPPIDGLTFERVAPGLLRARRVAGFADLSFRLLSTAALVATLWLLALSLRTLFGEAIDLDNARVGARATLTVAPRPTPGGTILPSLQPTPPVRKPESMGGGQDHEVPEWLSADAFPLTLSSSARLEGALTGGRARFTFPFSVATGPNGWLYVLDGGYGKVFVFDEEGVWQGALGEEKKVGHLDLRWPGGFGGGVAVDRDGQVWVVDGTGLVRGYAPHGAIIAEWRGGGQGAERVYGSYSLALDESGHLYLLDAPARRVRQFDRAGKLIAEWGEPGDGPGQLGDGASGIAVDRQGRVYVVDTGNSRVQLFNPGGAFVSSWGMRGEGAGEFSRPVGIAIDGAGRVYISDHFRQDVQLFDSDGTLVATWDVPTTAGTRFSLPFGIAASDSGGLYVTELTMDLVIRFTMLE